MHTFLYVDAVLTFSYNAGGRWTILESPCPEAPQDGCRRHPGLHPGLFLQAGLVLRPGRCRVAPSGSPHDPAFRPGLGRQLGDRQLSSMMGTAMMRFTRSTWACLSNGHRWGPSYLSYSPFKVVSATRACYRFTTDSGLPEGAEVTIFVGNAATLVTCRRQIYAWCPVQKGPMGQMVPLPAAAMGAYGIYGAAMMRPLLPMMHARGFGEAMRGRGRGPPMRGRGRGRW